MVYCLVNRLPLPRSAWNAERSEQKLGDKSKYK